MKLFALVVGLIAILGVGFAVHEAQAQSEPPTLQPTRQHIALHNFQYVFHLNSRYTADDVARLYTLQENGTSYIAVYDGHSFDTIPVTHSAGRLHLGYLSQTNSRVVNDDAHYETMMTWYYPVDPRMERIDVDGAVEAYQNASSTGWLFKHTSAGSHHDYELQLRGAVSGVFTPYLTQFLVDSITAASEDAKATAAVNYTEMAMFYGQVVNEAVKESRTRYLGEMLQKPHPDTGYLDNDMTTAVEIVKAKWQADRPAQWADISRYVGYIENNLRMPDPKPRWE